MGSNLPNLPGHLIEEEILVRLSAKAVFRFRAVCRRWLVYTSSEYFVSAFGSKPALPLLALYPDPANGLQSLDVLAAAEHRRPVLAFNRCLNFICASCDGLLLVSFGNGRHSICNPATRQSLPLPHLTGAVFAGLYPYPSPTADGVEYRVLFSNRGPRIYYVFTVGSPAEPRLIQLPQAPDGLNQPLFINHHNPSLCHPPAVLLNDILHWAPRRWQTSQSQLIVFNTVAESFGWIRSPPAAAAQYDTKLFEMDGQLGMSLYDGTSITVSIWLLQDYQNELWAPTHTISYPVAFRYLSYMVLSNGDVLLSSYDSTHVVHSDSEANILNEFSCEPRNPTLTGHLFKESLVRHTFFQRQKGKRSRPEPSFFKGL